MLTPQMVGMVGLEPTRPEGHQLLRLARLPIPPHADKLKTGNTLPKNVLLWFAEPSLTGGGDGIRTHNPLRAKQMLFQLELHPH